MLEGLLRREPAERLTAGQARAMLSEVASAPALAAPSTATLRLPGPASAASVPAAPADPVAGPTPVRAGTAHGVNGRDADRRRTVARILVGALGLMLVAGGVAGLVAATGDDGRAQFVDGSQVDMKVTATTCADGATPPGTVPPLPESTVHRILRGLTPSAPESAAPPPRAR
ncbi:hypothetical protein [Dactylosporangium sp. NPDC050588]|uniref:hypothetical protein n=1 Tax=Dactylosporangium sp. NPDC050588 TaxID=3157211 RepID=UPI0033D0CCA8